MQINELTTTHNGTYVSMADAGRGNLSSIDSNRILSEQNKGWNVTEDKSIEEILVHGEEEITDEELRRDDALGLLVNQAFNLPAPEMNLNN